MPDISITAEFTGPVFTKDAAAEIRAGANEGIRDLALHGQALVQGQLVKGHGVVTGHLRRSIFGGLVRDLHGQIDAGLHEQGANVHYADAVESGTRPHVIVPRTKRALAFKVGGVTVIRRRVNHPGTRGLHMFANAHRKLQQIDAQRFISERIARRFR